MYDDTKEPMVSLFRDAYQPVRPFALLWHNQEITITEIGYIQKLHEGKTVRHVFSCTDGITFFELIFEDAHIPFLAEHLVKR
jgi:hypothetical protein